MTALSVNLNKVALLRNARGGDVPSVMWAARTALDARAAGITLHPRPDRRHALPEDATALAAWLGEERPGVELNLEGNPFAGPEGAYPGFLEIVRQARPAQVTLVPDAPGQLTSDHGWDFGREAERLRPVIADLQGLGCRVSLFADAGSEVETAAEIGADRVELYTGPFAEAYASGDATAALAGLAETAHRARAAGLDLNAGHDLDLQNLGALLAAVPYVAEVSIGHALTADALQMGLAGAVRAYARVIEEAA